MTLDSGHGLPVTTLHILAGLLRTITSQRQILLALQHILRPQSFIRGK